MANPLPQTTAVVIVGALAFACRLLSAAEPVDFGRQIQPILSDRCYKCHGPDEAHREAKLRLDQKDGALAEREGRRAIVPGKAAASELIKRIISRDPDEQMPPPDSKLSLSKSEIELLRRWIDEGAEWKPHWAFVAPERPALPAVKQSDWTRNAVDRFVLARLEEEGLTPSAEADRRTLIRRVTLDLTGLPPTSAEVTAFLADERPDAYERLVDRLLASPRYGERMALPWLDAARYADTSGYQSDGPRHMWRWRDWVIDAFNNNMPFDQFTVEQLAGDLLPQATVSQRIATGFNRNHRGNAEGGIIAAEYEVEYVVDRVDTTATVWLGLTLGCTRCHDHKYDPFTQEEFYKLYAYFNSIPEFGRALKEGNSPPIVTAPTREQTEQLTALLRRVERAEATVKGNQIRLIAAQRDWEKSAKAAELPEWNYAEGRTLRYTLDDLENLQAMGSEPQVCAGRHGRARDFDGTNWLEAGDVANFGYADKFSLAAWIRPAGTDGGAIVSRMTDAEEGDGYSLVVIDGKLHVRLVKRWLDDAIRVETAEPVIVADRWQHVLVTYDGSRRAAGIVVYVDGERAPLKVNLDAINQTFAAKDQPLRIGAGGGPKSRFHGAIDEVQIFNRGLSAEEAVLAATPDSLRDIVSLPSEKRSWRQEAKLKAYYTYNAAPEDLRRMASERTNSQRELESLVESLPNVMAMEELSSPKPAHVLLRGQYDRPGKQVTRGVPQILPPLPTSAPQNRLGLAQWIVDRRHPLTARVAVNRQWQLFFGQGLVATTEDFGTQGERPTHGALLDWLAVELPASGWDMKSLQRLMVTSATYRQSSQVSPALRERDPDNRLLARGARFRLSAHTVRDQALALSGLLVNTTGGPSVKPYQPPGLWEELAGAGAKYTPDQGANLYRRSLYTYWKRTAAPPTLMTFDAADRETCVVRRARTNTPLQALTLLNETTYVEAARKFAERALQTSPENRRVIEWMFVEATGRQPEHAELSILTRSRDFARERFAKSPEEAGKLLAVGDTPADAALDRAELAAHAVVAGLILNLDEVITRE